MSKHIDTAVLCLLGILLMAGIPARGAGPDVIVGDINELVYSTTPPYIIPGVTHWGQIGNVHSYSIGTFSCNVGDENLLWDRETNRHPVIAQHMFRLKNGRFEQIGMAWLKHGFGTVVNLVDVGCGECNGVEGEILGIGCTDPYDSETNGQHYYLGPRSEVNPSTGAFPYPFVLGWEQFGNSIFKRLQVRAADLDPAANPGALYFLEAHYVTADDAAAGNGNNNASYRRATVNPDFSMDLEDQTQREMPAIQAWRDQDPAVTETTVDVPGDGRFWVASKSSANGNGTWHYEFAVHNLNSHRAGKFFSVPIPPGAVVTNVGFHDVDYHSGEAFVGTDWPGQTDARAVGWQTTDIQANPNANALRWGTLYNFRFDADAPPVAGAATLGLFRPGPASRYWLVAVQAPSAVRDCNGNGISDATDIGLGGGSPDCNGNAIPDSCEINDNDCNTNGIPDDCEDGSDCDLNGLPDECEASAPDCNTNGVLDVCENSEDCNTNGVLDACDAVGADCNSNQIPDECDIAEDCNGNLLPDDCDAAADGDCNSNGVPDSCDVFGLAGGVQRYESPLLNRPVPNPGSTSHTVSATNPGRVLDVNVFVEVRHPFSVDLIVRLSHDGTTIDLWNSWCGNSDDIIVTFDDAAFNVFCGNPTIGSANPESTGGDSLSTFNDMNAFGDWTLTVEDTFPDQGGTLMSWALIVTTPSGYTPTSPDEDHDGLPDECECATCQGDLTGDGRVDGADIGRFIGAMLGAFDKCADLNLDGPPVDSMDTDMFVQRLLDAPSACTD